jgi:hypothetical protein
MEFALNFDGHKVEIGKMLMLVIEKTITKVCRLVWRRNMVEERACGYSICKPIPTSRQEKFGLDKGNTS